jgi:nucleotide-binding universal stress UspA family protein
MNILFPTDFSENAKTGLNFVIQLVNELGANLHLLTSFEDPRPTGSFVSISDVLRKDAENDLAKLVGEIEMKVNSEVKSYVAQSEPEYAISNYASRNAIDLIAIPTKGMSNVGNMILGSVTKRVVAETETPVLVIPIGTDYHEIHGKILFGVDAKPIKSSVGVNLINTLAKKFSTKINFVHIKDENEPVTSELIKSIENTFGDNYGELLIFDKDGSPSETITAYAFDNNYDFAVMIKRKKSFIEKLITSSQSSKSAGITKIPLIIIKED